jgi:hypothetical protein
MSEAQYGPIRPRYMVARRYLTLRCGELGDENECGAQIWPWADNEWRWIAYTRTQGKVRQFIGAEISRARAMDAAEKAIGLSERERREARISLKRWTVRRKR